MLSKAGLLLAILLSALTVTHSLHMQYMPSKAGISSTSSASSSCAEFPPPSRFGGFGQTKIMIGDSEYRYAGNFKLTCHNRDGSFFRCNHCSGEGACGAMLMAYKQCVGPVKMVRA